MNRDLEKLASDRYDVVVIGGGIFGACAAWDAVLRGMKVALIEKDDFCSGTSANSFKMIHGGIRYLQHADIIRLRSSCHERSAFLRVAPHLALPLPILIPTYGFGKSGKLFLGIGMFLYDLLTLGRNKGIRDKTRHIPWTQFFNRERVLRDYPDLDSDGLTGAAMFHDGQMYNPTRLVLAFVKSALEKGARVANYVEARQLVRDGNKIIGVDVVDKLTDSAFRIHANVVLNAAGPWSEWLLEKSLGTSGAGQHGAYEEKGVYSRDACFVVKRKFESDWAIAVQGRTKDPDALLSRPARHLFLVPWREYTLVGVWHVVWKNHPEDVTVTEEQINEFIAEINWAYPGLKLSSTDVNIWNAGLVPFGENESGAENLSYGKRSHLIDHKKADGVDGLVTLIGIRYTMARADAAKAVDMVAARLGMPVKQAPTASTPVAGGDIDDFDALVEDMFRSQKCGLSQACVRALAHNHGTRASDVIALADSDNSLAEAIGDSLVIKAEIDHAVENEMAQSLADVVFRRTDLATGGNPGKQVLGQCAAHMAKLLNWDQTRIDKEITAVLSRFPDWIAAE